MTQTSSLLAMPEKALLDWIYIRKIKHVEIAELIETHRLDLSMIDFVKLKSFSSYYPGYIQSIIEKTTDSWADYIYENKLPNHN